MGDRLRCGVSGKVTSLFESEKAGKRALCSSQLGN